MELKNLDTDRFINHSENRQKYLNFDKFWQNELQPV